MTLKKAGSKSKKISTKISEKEAPIPSGDNAPIPVLHTPSDPSGITTPALMSLSGTSTPIPPGSNPAERIAALLPSEEPDGATVNCVSVCELCFKVGRITVPPAIVLALDGYSVAPPEGDPAYSHANPPPSFVTAQALAETDAAKGHMKTLQAFLCGGWRDVPEGQRWWEDALGGDIEERRKRNLEAVIGVRLGLEGAMESHL